MKHRQLKKHLLAIALATGLIGSALAQTTFRPIRPFKDWHLTAAMQRVRL